VAAKNEEALVLALAVGDSAAAAAKKAGVHERTVRRRLAKPTFRARVAQARAEMLGSAVGRLASLGGTAANTLRDLVAEGTPPAVRLGAARAALEYLFRGAEVDTLARQVEDLKQQVEELSRGNGNVAEGPGADAGADRGAARGRPDEPARSAAG
jgi:hypothetical protein